MKFNLYTFTSILTFVLFTSSAQAGSWVDESQNWNPPTQSSAKRSQNSSRRSVSAREYQRLKDLRPFSPDSNNISLQVGQTFLMGDLSSYDDSLGFSGNYTYGISRLMAFDSTLGYSSHSQGKYSLVSLMAGARMNLSYYDRVIPYLTGGLGFYRPSRAITDSSTLSATLFGLHVGAGADLSISPEMFFGASLTFHNAFASTKQTSSGPVNLGGSYTNFVARVGYTF